MNKESNDFLWLWILGMTDLIIHAKAGTGGSTSSHSLDQDLLEITNEVQRLNPHIYNKQDDGAHYDPFSEQDQ